MLCPWLQRGQREFGTMLLSGLRGGPRGGGYWAPWASLAKLREYCRLLACLLALDYRLLPTELHMERPKTIGLVTGPGGLFATGLVTKRGRGSCDKPRPRTRVCNRGPATKVCNREWYRDKPAVRAIHIWRQLQRCKHVLGCYRALTTTLG